MNIRDVKIVTVVENVIVKKPKCYKLKTDVVCSESIKSGQVKN
jgi:hypothetical protein